ncbi:hypothetical protein HOT81_gp104 [Gordonia phage Fryberger]|uniref:Uncharacterized protein n=1 Tax=Gordonia phage Fryberger TaxID=2250392 RepID=A0A346FCQ6_9CAUD|nr:hypothetical protein HOT81_gp104 [Gordonia phage Fryberger]AXN53520.1 hypothetical protein SEA_FRYBERGER_104 [Gordonia phage Fryberger]
MSAVCADCAREVPSPRSDVAYWGYEYELLCAPCFYRKVPWPPDAKERALARLRPGERLKYPTIQRGYVRTTP